MQTELLLTACWTDTYLKNNCMILLNGIQMDTKLVVLPPAMLMKAYYYFNCVVFDRAILTFALVFRS